MPVKKDDNATLVNSSPRRPEHSTAESASPPRSYRATRAFTSKTLSHTTSSALQLSSGDDTSSSWLGRLWSGLRRRAETAEPTEAPGTSPVPGAIVESGAAAVGPVRDPHVVIPADIMFSPQRTALYGNMVSMLVRNPYYLTRIVSHVKHHECDALLSIILDSLFGGPAYEPLLTALFTEIVELEVDRTTSIDTVMRNDGPSVHMLSAYLKRHCCLEYLRIAVGPTIETMVALGNTSLDPELASVYQDWARSQTAMRLPLVASAVEAAGYTEVQNLSRRRQRHLVHLATHCLHDVINAQHHIPAGLLAICASTMRTTKRKFPDTDLAKAYSLVGGIFFLRFVNAALTSPNHYGLLDAAPGGTMKTNLKLLARLMQRLSNYSAKPADEWPVDARKFMKANVFRFHSFLASLTTGAGDAKILPTAAISRQDSVESQLQPIDKRDSSGTSDSNSSGSGRRRNSESSGAKCASVSTRSRRSNTGANGSGDPTKANSSAKRVVLGEASGAAFSPAHDDDDDEVQSPPQDSTSGIRTSRSRGRQLSRVPMRPPSCAAAEASQLAPGLSLVSTGSTITATSTINPASQFDKSSMVSVIIKNTRPNPGGTCQILCKKSDGDRAGRAKTPDDSYSTKSMYDIGRQEGSCNGGTDGGAPQCVHKAERNSSECHDVVLPLNDLYLLQKYLAIYEDKWAPGEAKYIADKSGEGLLTPMADCLRALGTVPTQVRTYNNHKTRIPLVLGD
ncbi:RasGAP protein [Coemansia furcata]|uniref:RasGAP protein n=1 Tax=Coemansia furcata TaxID=417177 RepID=A0ACC1LMA1_9FUNG|nr:RasGAP protein [Coemansia furcata]